MDEEHSGRMNEEHDGTIDRAMSREELEELLCAHYQYVRILAWKKVEPDEFEDVANEAMMDAYEGLDTLREPAYIKSWLYTIVGNRIKAHYAKRDKRKKIDETVRMEAGCADLADLSEFAAGEAVFREMMQRAEDADLAREILDSLDPVHKRIMYMRFWEGYTFEEISDIMGIKAVTLRSMYVRCRDRLCEKYKNVGKEAGRDEGKK